MNVDEIAAQLPKVELHLHLDGSLSKGKEREINQPLKNGSVVFLIVLLAGFIGGRASARGIQLPDEQDIEGWLQRQKTASLAKNPSNKVRLIKTSRLGRPTANFAYDAKQQTP